MLIDVIYRQLVEDFRNIDQVRGYSRDGTKVLDTSIFRLEPRRPSLTWTRYIETTLTLDSPVFFVEFPIQLTTIELLNNRKLSLDYLFTISHRVEKFHPQLRLLLTTSIKWETYVET